jgi:hypothetical protein
MRSRCLPSFRFKDELEQACSLSGEGMCDILVVRPFCGAFLGPSGPVLVGPLLGSCLGPSLVLVPFGTVSVWPYCREVGRGWPREQRPRRFTPFWDGDDEKSDDAGRGRKHMMKAKARSDVKKGESSSPRRERLGTPAYTVRARTFVIFTVRARTFGMYGSSDMVLGFVRLY